MRITTPSPFSIPPILHPRWSFLSSRIPPPPSSTLFPYTTLFRSLGLVADRHHQARQVAADRIDHREFERVVRSEEHTSELQSLAYLVCRLLLEKKKRVTFWGSPCGAQTRSSACATATCSSAL